MLGAAPKQAPSATDADFFSSLRPSKWLGAASLAALALVVFVPAATGASSQSPAKAGLPRLWAVQVSTGAGGWFDRTLLKSVRTEGVNALAVRVSALGSKASAAKTFDSVRRFADAEKLYLVAVLPAGKAHTRAARHAAATCSSRRFSRLRCAVQAHSVTAAAKLARESNATRPLVAVYVRGPRNLSGLTRLPKRLRRRILVIAPLAGSFDTSAWSAAIGQTAASPSLNMGIAPQGRQASTALQQFARLLHGGSSAAGVTDTQPPSQPTGLTAGSATRSSLSLSWNASTDNVGVAGYRVYLNGSQVGTTGSTGYGFTGLACGTTYSLGVAAYDAAGNVSGTATVSQATSACPDTQTPSTPSGLATSAVTETSMSLSWNAATDNVGVAGYRLLLDGSLAGTSSSTSYSFTGLTCGTAYTLGVVAYDAAGNLSGTATLSRSTSACTDTQAPSKPTGLATSSVTQTSMSLSWNASTDNVGVSGYRLYRNGTQVGTKTSTGYSFTGLSCGTSYTLGVAAYDASGNVSARATVSRATSACTSPPANTSPPAVSGSASVGSDLTSTTGAWTNSPTSYSYQWQDCDSSGAGCTDIATATGTTYTVQPSDLGDTVRAVVTAANVAGSASADSAVTAVVQAAPPPSGQTVMAFDLGWDPTSNMPWNDLTQADLFNLATEAGPGLDTSNVDNIDIPAWVTAAHAHGVQAMISIGGDGNNNWGTACNATNRTQFISNLLNFAVSNGFDGVDLDIEDGPWLGVGPPTPAMTTCIETIATTAHATLSKAGKPLWVSADVITNWDGYWFAPSESYVDQYNLMTYGDSLSTMKSDVLDTFNQGLPYDKMVVGVDVADYPEPGGGCAQFENYAKQSSLMGSFVWAAQPDTNNVCMNALAASAG